MMKNLQLPLNFSQLTQFQWLFPLVKSCWLTWLIMITLPAYSAEWINGSDPKCKGTVIVGGPACLCLKIANEELPVELKDNETPIRYKWFRYIGTKPYFEENQKPSKKVFDEQHWQLCSVKENIQSGLWQIDAVYANNEPVKCNNNQDCHFSIRVE